MLGPFGCKLARAGQRCINCRLCSSRWCPACGLRSRGLRWPDLVAHRHSLSSPVPASARIPESSSYLPQRPPLTRPAGFRRFLAVSRSLWRDGRLLLDEQRLPAADPGRGMSALPAARARMIILSGAGRSARRDAQGHCPASTWPPMWPASLAGCAATGASRSAPRSFPASSTPPCGQPRSPVVSFTCTAPADGLSRAGAAARSGPDHGRGRKSRLAILQAPR